MRPTLNLPIIGAVFTALLSTLCCLPAFLFLFFGISSGALTVLTHLEFLRIPLALATFLFLLLAVIKQNKKIACECTQSKKIKYAIFYGLVLLGIMALLLYPEIIPLFME